VSGVGFRREQRRLADGQQDFLSSVTFYITRVITGVVCSESDQVQRPERVQERSRCVVGGRLGYSQQKSIFSPRHLTHNEKRVDK